MANVLKQIFSAGVDQIDQTYTIEAWHVSQSVDAFTAAKEYNINISGSLAITGSLFATASHAYSGSKVYIASNNSTNTDFTLVFKNSIGALGSHYELAADGANGPYYNPSSNILTAPIVSGSSIQATSLTGSLSGSVIGNVTGTATSASYAVAASSADISISTSGITSGYTPSGSAVSSPGTLKVFAGAGKTSTAPPYQAIVNVNPNTDLTSKILNQNLFLATAPSQSGATIGVVTSSPTSITFESNIPNIDFTFIGTYI
jgi:hypothetical protein